MTANMSMPVTTMPRMMPRVRMKSVWLRGLSAITSRDGGREASARAAKVSMMIFTHSI